MPVDRTKDFQDKLAFAVPFFQALVRLRNCVNQGSKGVYLTRAEATAILKGFRLLRGQLRDKR